MSLTVSASTASSLLSRPDNRASEKADHASFRPNGEFLSPYAEGAFDRIRDTGIHESILHTMYQLIIMVLRIADWDSGTNPVYVREASDGQDLMFAGFSHSQYPYSKASFERKTQASNCSIQVWHNVVLNELMWFPRQVRSSE